jgi:hypothetical protein
VCGVECRVDARCDAFRLTDSHPVIHQSFSVGTRRDASEGFDQTKCAYGKKISLRFFSQRISAGDFAANRAARSVEIHSWVGNRKALSKVVLRNQADLEICRAAAKK